MSSPSTPVLLSGAVAESPITGGFVCPLDGTNAPSNFNCDGATIYSASGFGSAYFNTPFLNDHEAFLNSPSDTADNYFAICVQTPGVNFSGYIAHWHSLGVGAVDIARYDAGVGGSSKTYDVSALVTGLAIDNTHQIWLQKSRGDFNFYFDGNLVGSFIDNTYTGGYFGFETNATSAGGFTKWGGGALTGSVKNGDLSQFPKGAMVRGGYSR